MIQTTNDILQIVKAFSLLWISICLGLLFFYSAMTVRQAFVMLRNTRKRLKKIDQIIKKCHNSMGQGASGMIYIMEGAKILIDSLKKKSEINKRKTKAKKKTQPQE